MNKRYRPTPPVLAIGNENVITSLLSKVIAKAPTAENIILKNHSRVT